MESRRIMVLNYFHWHFVDFNVNVRIYCSEILILSYSDFTLYNVNFDLGKRSGFK